MSETDDQAFFREFESHGAQLFLRVMRRLPRDPRCAVCHAPYGGIGGLIMGRVGFAPSRKNPRLCNACFEKAPMGGVQMDIGVLFADVRGFTALAEARAPDFVAALLNRFYAAPVKVLCKHAIIDKLVGDQVMALYLPRVFPGNLAENMISDLAENMISDARAPLAAAGYDDGNPWVQLGVGLDFGSAYVGNVGAGEVKDFTAIGDVVNTAARLQAAAGSGEIVMSRRVCDRVGNGTVAGESRELSLKGKSEPEPAVVARVGLSNSR
jgi:adenylate cyclase